VSLLIAEFIMYSPIFRYLVIYRNINTNKISEQVVSSLVIVAIKSLSEINSEKKDRLSSGSTVEKCFYRIIIVVV